MRKAWRTSAMAVLGAAATMVSTAAASPAGMSLRGNAPAQAPSAAAESQSSAWSFWRSSEQPAPAAPRAVSTDQPQPSTQISPWRNPIRYFSAAMSETPAAAALKKDKPPKTGAVAAAGSSGQPEQGALDTPAGPPTPPLFISLAQMAERQGDVPQARRQYQQALGMWPNEVEVLRAAARMEDRQGDLALAESLYQRAVATNPQHAGALNDLGLCLARQGKLEPSVHAIEQAIQLQPEKPLYRNNAATVLVELRQDHRAMEHLAAVHGSAAANYNMGQLLVARNRAHDSVGYFYTALELDPSLEAARVAIAQIQGGTPHEPTQVAVESPTTPRPTQAPAMGPQLAPQQPAPQQAYPATARGPAFGASTYVPPAAQPPASQSLTAPTAPVYQSATAPRYLPPVHPMTPGNVVR